MPKNLDKKGLIRSIRDRVRIWTKKVLFVANNLDKKGLIHPIELLKIGQKRSKLSQTIRTNLTGFVQIEFGQKRSYTVSMLFGCKLSN
jgi:hypothetical protein